MILEISFYKDALIKNNLICYRHVFNDLDLENFVLPKYKPLSGDFMSMCEYQQKMEQQRRFIDMISSKIAYNMTDYMINKYWEDINKLPQVVFKNAGVIE